jgi:HEAT repeat protein
VLHLALARALAKHSEDVEGRQALVRLLGAAADGAEPEDAMALGTAALALARSGTPDAVASLGRALWQSAPVERAAREALLAYPPTDLAPLLESARSSRALPALLGELGDRRAYDYLRGLVRAAPPARAATAAWALHRMGFQETRELARYWWTKSTRPEHRLTAARILVEAGDALGPPALEALLTQLPADTESRNVVLELAARQPSGRWEAPLLALARPILAARTTRHLSREQEAWVLLALARLDQPQGVRELVAALSGPSALASAEALARSEGRRATSALEATLEDPARRAWALRVLAVRQMQRVEAEKQVPGQSRLLETARLIIGRPRAPGEDGKTATEVAAAAWALALVSPGEAEKLLLGSDPVARRAVGRQAFRGPLATAAARHLAAAPAKHTSATTGVLPLLNGLNDAQAAEHLPTRALFRLSGDASEGVDVGWAPPRVRVLASRLERHPARPENENWGPLQDTRRWLTADDPALRASAALGLARAEAPIAVALLANRLAQDPEAVVRRAATQALMERAEPAARVPLEDARSLDPDAEVRRLAGAPVRSLALAERSRDSGRPLLWQTAEGPLLLTTHDGSSLLLVPDPDGFVGVLSAPGETWRLVPLPVAKPTARGEASR